MGTGKVCGNCQGGQCSDCPSELEPLEIADVENDDEWVSITGCPKKMIDPNTNSFLAAAELFEDGHPVVPGGQMDQADGFLKAFRFFKGEKLRALNHG